MEFQINYDIIALVLHAAVKQGLANTNFLWIDSSLVTSVQVTEFQGAASRCNLALSDVQNGVRRLCRKQYLNLLF
jgi:hypothetical protein